MVAHEIKGNADEYLKFWRRKLLNFWLFILRVPSPFWIEVAPGFDRDLTEKEI